MNIPLSPCVPENLISRDGFSRPIPRQPAHLHTQADVRVLYAPYVVFTQSRNQPAPRPRLRIWSINSKTDSPGRPASACSFSTPRMNLVFSYRLSGRPITYRWRSLPRVCQHRTSKPVIPNGCWCCLGRSQ